MKLDGEPILRTRDVVKEFGGVRALDRCSVEVRAQSITGLIGPNGAGKSTLFNVIIGLYGPDEGQILFHGDPIEGVPTYQLVERGIVKTFQIPRELRNLTVMENLLISAKRVPGESLLRVVFVPWKGRARDREVQERAERLLDFVGLSQLRDEYAKNLSGGQKKLLELTRALMSDPSMILLDEPVAGVNPTLATKILDLIERLRNEGKTIFLIEHDMEVVMRRCDWIIVLHQGRKLAEGAAADIRKHERVVDAYLGG